MPRNRRPRKQWCKEDGHLSEPPPHWAQLQCCCSGERKVALGTVSREDLQHTHFPVEGTSIPARAFGYPQQTLLLWAAVCLAQKARNSRTKPSCFRTFHADDSPWKSKNSPETPLALRSTSALVTQAFITSRSSPPLFRDQKLHENSQ